jgi:predicted Ser/Thr protein kinase
VLHLGLSSISSKSCFVLAEDTKLVPVSELPVSLRNELRAGPDDLILDRRKQRMPSKLISSDTAILLKKFRSPKTISDAVLELGLELDSEPIALLELAFPTIQKLVQSGFLVPVDRSASQFLVTGGSIEDRIGRFKVVRPIRVLEDTSVYLAKDKDGTFVAIKMVTAANNPQARASLLREAETLVSLEGLQVPKVLEISDHTGAAYFAMRWIEGLPVAARADEIRRKQRGERAQLFKLCIKVAEVLADVHSAGVLHGDVKSANMLVDRYDRVYLIDFGMAVSETSVRPTRSCDFESLEPEAAERLLAGQPALPTLLGEQFALAVLIYRLASGNQFRHPPLEQQEALESIAATRYIPPFTTGYCEAWPDMERVLRCALARDPAERYPSTRSFCRALRGVKSGRWGSPSRIGIADIANKTIDVASADGVSIADLYSYAPRASVHYGAAGMSWFLYRAAQIREDGLLLALADRWARAASVDSAGTKGLISSKFGITRSKAFRSSPLHDVSGPAAVRCLIACARQDEADARSSLQIVTEVLRRRSVEQEIFMGNAGHIVAAATLHDALVGHAIAEGSALEAELANRLTQLIEWISNREAIGNDPRLGHLGMAHGWAGLLYAALVAGHQLAIEPSVAVKSKLQELASLAEPIGRGLSWVGTINSTGSLATPAYAPGWCSGSSGYVMLWLAAFDVLHDECYRDLAVRAGWHAWEHPDDSPNLCCGLGGRAAALLRLYRGVGDEDWLEKSRRLVEYAVNRPFSEKVSRYSLFRGQLGLALLALELERPSRSVMPLIEPEGWSDGAAWLNR